MALLLQRLCLVGDELWLIPKWVMSGGSGLGLGGVQRKLGGGWRGKRKERKH